MYYGLAREKLGHIPPMWPMNNCNSLLKTYRQICRARRVIMRNYEETFVLVY